MATSPPPRGVPTTGTGLRPDTVETGARVGPRLAAETPTPGVRTDRGRVRPRPNLDLAGPRTALLEVQTLGRPDTPPSEVTTWGDVGPIGPAAAGLRVVGAQRTTPGRKKMRRSRARNAAGILLAATAQVGSQTGGREALPAPVIL